MVIHKKGWIKIVEAFISILLIVGVLLVLLNKGYLGEDISSKVYDAELSILRGVQLDTELRRDILISNRSGYPDTIEIPLPIEWEEFEDVEGERVLADVKEKIIDQTPSYLECIAKICELEDDCLSNELERMEIYTQHVSITSTYDIWSPRKLKLFCWVK